MKIERVELWLIKLDLLQPFVTASSATSERELIILKVYSDLGVAFGEACPLSTPGYSDETIETAWAALNDLIVPRILNQSIDSPEALHAWMDAVPGHRMAKAGLDGAYYELMARSVGLPLATFLGGQRAAVDAGISLGIPGDTEGHTSGAQLAEQVSQALKQGYKRVKIKIRPGWDLEPVRRLRDDLGGFPLMVDANAAYTLDEAGLFQQLDQYKLLMIEQPLAAGDLAAHARLQAQIETPICLDESIRSLADAEAAISLDAGRIVNIKLARVGGFLPAQRIHDACQAAGIPAWVGGMYESGIGKADSAALATLSNFQFPADIAPSERYFVQDIVKGGLQLMDGQILIPEGSGRGVEVDEEFLEQVTQTRTVLS